MSARAPLPVHRAGGSDASRRRRLAGWIVLAIASGAALTVMVIDYMRKKNSDR